MITNIFDPTGEEIIKVWKNEAAPKADVCIVTFSRRILDYVLEHYHCTEAGSLYSSNGETKVYLFRSLGCTLGIYMSPVGAPGCVADIEDALSVINTRRFVVFGGAGCLNKDIARGRVMIPCRAYRDEGTSYHYAPAADYIDIKNCAVVERFMKEAGLACVMGGTWTTDAIHRETRPNFEQRKAQGCISVEMECAAVQAMCGFRGLEAYFFFTSGDLLDAPQWDARLAAGETEGTQHDPGHFEIARELACYVCAQFKGE